MLYKNNNKKENKNELEGQMEDFQKPVELSHISIWFKGPQKAFGKEEAGLEGDPLVKADQLNQPLLDQQEEASCRCEWQRRTHVTASWRAAAEHCI